MSQHIQQYLWSVNRPLRPISIQMATYGGKNTLSYINDYMYDYMYEQKSWAPYRQIYLHNTGVSSVH